MAEKGKLGEASDTEKSGEFSEIEKSGETVEIEKSDESSEIEKSDESSEIEKSGEAPAHNSNGDEMSDRVYTVLVKIEKSLKDLVEVFNSLKDVVESDDTNKSIDKGKTEQDKKPEKKELKTVSSGRQMAKATFDYYKTSEDELSFKVGELMEIISSFEDGWCMAKKQKNAKQGLIPSNFVELVTGKDAAKNNLSAHSWYHGKISKEVAEIKLKYKQNDIGTFLVRKSAKNSECSFVLSVLSKEKDKDGCCIVKHYEIKRDENKTKYFVSPSKTFNSLQKLIDSYSEKPEDLCCNLTASCPVYLKRNAISTADKKTSELLEIPFTELTIVSKTLEGEFSEIWKGKHQEKVDIELRKFKEGNANIKEFLCDAVAIKSLSHERLVQFLGVSSDSGCYYIVTELLAGSLLNFLRESPKQPLIGLLRIAIQVAEGIIYLKSQRCIHLDLAARNILMVDDKNIKIGGFEFVRKIKNGEDEDYFLYEGTKSPIRWISIEMMHHIFTIKSDVWAYGILLVELTTKGRTPYPDKSNREVLYWVDDGKCHPQPQSCPDDLYSLMLDCWKAESRERPSFSDIVSRIEEMIKKMSADDDTKSGK